MKQQQLDYEPRLPECAFRFNYLQAQTIDEDYAERLVEDLEENRK